MKASITLMVLSVVLNNPNPTAAVASETLCKSAADCSKKMGIPSGLIDQNTARIRAQILSKKPETKKERLMLGESPYQMHRFRVPSVKIEERAAYAQKIAEEEGFSGCMISAPVVGQKIHFFADCIEPNFFWVQLEQAYEEKTAVLSIEKVTKRGQVKVCHRKGGGCFKDQSFNEVFTFTKSFPKVSIFKKRLESVTREKSKTQVTSQRSLQTSDEEVEICKEPENEAYTKELYSYSERKKEIDSLIVGCKNVVLKKRAEEAERARVEAEKARVIEEKARIEREKLEEKARKEREIAEAKEKEERIKKERAAAIENDPEKKEIEKKKTDLESEKKKLIREYNEKSMVPFIEVDQNLEVVVDTSGSVDAVMPNIKVFLKDIISFEATEKNGVEISVTKMGTSGVRGPEQAFVAKNIVKDGPKKANRSADHFRQGNADRDSIKEALDKALRNPKNKKILVLSDGAFNDYYENLLLLPYRGKEVSFVCFNCVGSGRNEAISSLIKIVNETGGVYKEVSSTSLSAEESAALYRKILQIRAEIKAKAEQLKKREAELLKTP